MRRLLIVITCLALFGCSGKTDDGDNKTTAYDAIFFGDSITANWVNEAKGGHPEFFRENNYLCMGYSGYTSAGLKPLFNKSVTERKPKYGVILCGTNDIAKNDGEYVPAETTRDNIAWMASEASKNGVKVVLCSVLPSTHYWWVKEDLHPEDAIIALNELIKALAVEKGYGYADYYSSMVDSKKGLPSAYSNDGVHPNRDGYAVMENIIVTLLK